MQIPPQKRRSVLSIRSQLPQMSVLLRNTNRCLESDHHCGLEPAWESNGKRKEANFSDARIMHCMKARVIDTYWSKKFGLKENALYEPDVLVLSHVQPWE